MRRTLRGLVAGSATLVFAALAPAQSRLDIELQSLRALQPGFRAWCESGHLIFRSRTSARFRIRDAALCVGKPDGHILCSAEPGAGGGIGKAAILPCSDISAPGT